MPFTRQITKSAHAKQQPTAKQSTDTNMPSVGDKKNRSILAAARAGTCTAGTHFAGTCFADTRFVDTCFAGTRFADACFVSTRYAGTCCMALSCADSGYAA